MTLLIAAVDPGASPTIAFLDPNGALSFVEGDALAGKTPTGKTRPIPALCRQGVLSGPASRLPDLLVIEDVRGMPGDARGSGEVLTYCVGLFEGIAAALDVRAIRVVPQKWKRWAGLLKADKAASRAVACNLFTAQAGLFRRVKDHNRADAALMAAWAAAPDRRLG